jgi:hypothetical protein
MRIPREVSRTGNSTVWVRRDELEGVVDVATPLPTEQPIVNASEQQRVRPTALAATADDRIPKRGWVGLGDLHL